MSKVGTKHAGARSTTTAETFDQLRVENYTSASVGIDALPPTSRVIRGHIHRGAFLVRRACQLLVTEGERDARITFNPRVYFSITSLRSMKYNVITIHTMTK